MTDQLQIALTKINELRELTNESFKNDDKATVALKTIALTYTACKLYEWVYHNDKHVSDRVQQYFFKVLRQLPVIGDKIKAEVEKAKTEVRSQKSLYNPTYIMELPQKSSTAEEMIMRVESYLNMDTVDWKGGKVQGAVYDFDKEIIEVCSKAYEMFMWSNPLHADVFKGVRKMEAEIISMVLKLYKAPSSGCGLVTSGGTESIGLACLAARNHAMDRGVKWPELVMPTTAHSAFDKACHYFRIKLVRIPVDPVTYRVDLKKVESAINRNTCLIVGSAPTYPHGAYDDIEALSKLALKYGKLMHVDACLGGFINPFAKDAGYSVPLLDFRLEGVTSISADTHKYGYCPKGSSTVMFRTPELRRKAIFSCTEWPGGVYATPTYAGSRPGANSAVCWATMNKIGYNGYVERTKDVLTASMKFKHGINKMEHLEIMGDPVGSVIAFCSKTINVFQLMADLKDKHGWKLGPIQFPSGLHISVTHLHSKPGVAEQLLKDLEACSLELAAKGEAPIDGGAAVYGLSQTIPDRSIVGEIATTFIETCMDTNRDYGRNNPEEQRKSG